MAQSVPVPVEKFHPDKPDSAPGFTRRFPHCARQDKLGEIENSAMEMADKKIVFMALLLGGNTSLPISELK